MNFLFTLLRSQLFTKLPYPEWDFHGQTVVITGSNTGLGLEAARHIVRLGAEKVILAVRTISKGEKAAESIIQTTHATSNVLEVWPLDLSDYDSIKAFGVRLQSLDRLDALIQNAGVLTNHFKSHEKSGLESHIGINSVAAVFVGLVALPKLKETALKAGTRPRLAFIGSELHFIAKFQEAEHEGSLFNVLSSEEIADMDDRYKVSKLLLHFATQELASRMPLSSESNVIITDATPGACESDLFRDDMSWLRGLFQSIALRVFARTTEVGSRTLVHSVNPTLEPEAHGRFLMNCRVVDDWETVTSERGQSLRKRWISELFARLESISPGVTRVLQEQ